MRNKAQATLEFALAWIIVIVLIAGFLRIAQWSSSHLSARQSEFEATRVAAGSKSSPGEPRIVYQAPAMGDGDLYLLRK